MEDKKGILQGDCAGKIVADLFEGLVPAGVFSLVQGGAVAVFGAFAALAWWGVL